MKEYKLMESKDNRNKFEQNMNNSMLGKEGLTITSANHLANIAKEMYEAIEAKLGGIRLYSRDYQLAVNGNSYRVENESSKEDLKAFGESLAEIGRLKSFIAYLREAIKAKTKLEGEEAFEQYLNEEIERGRDELKRPGKVEPVTFEEEFAKLSNEQKARYYALEAKCATIGSYIHPKGVLSTARVVYLENLKNPIRVSGKGSEAEISTFSSTFTEKEVDEEFFALQSEYRRLQAEFNKLKSEIEERANEATREANECNLCNSKAWMDRRKVERGRYNAEVKALKIVIADNIKEAYELVNSVATAR